MVENFGPVDKRLSPFLGDVAMSQEKQFGSSLVRGKRRFRFDDLAKLAVITLNSIGGIDKTANIGRKIEESESILDIV